MVKISYGRKFSQTGGLLYWKSIIENLRKSFYLIMALSLAFDLKKTRIRWSCF